MRGHVVVMPHWIPGMNPAVDDRFPMKTPLGARVWFGVALVVVVLLVIGVIPQRNIPEQLAPVLSVKGKFEGKPIHVRAPGTGKRLLPATVSIAMDRGVCQVSLKTGTTRTQLCRMGAGNVRVQAAAGSELLLDPQGNTGDYAIALGPEWHPLGPKTRRFVLLPMAITLAVGFVLRGKIQSQLVQLGAKRACFLAGLAVISGLVLYPVIHEFGHILSGMICGAKPDWAAVVWTPLRGEEPHAAFSYLPQGAGPLMSAGGTLLPTVAALVLLATWKLINRRVSWYVSAVLVGLPGLWLISTLGCLFELHQNTHMDALAVDLGLKGPLRVLFSVSPLLVAAAAYAWLGMEYRGRKKGIQGEPPSVGPRD